MDEKKAMRVGWLVLVSIVTAVALVVFVMWATLPSRSH